jgi:hypothetical protein
LRRDHKIVAIVTARDLVELYQRQVWFCVFTIN